MSTEEEMLQNVLVIGDYFHELKAQPSSTPLKTRSNLLPKKSLSLLDMTFLDDTTSTQNKLNLSNDTLASQGSGFRDSGFNQSVESSVNGSGKQTPLPEDDEEQCLIDLIEELKFKNVMITELQESNKCLRMKFAEAENKIAELRLKSESHCSCCLKPQGTSGMRSLRAEKECDSLKSSNSETGIKVNGLPPITDFIVKTNLSGRIARSDQSNLVTSDGTAHKRVKCWQDKLIEATKTDCLEMGTYSKNKHPTDQTCASDLEKHIYGKNHPQHVQRIGEEKVSVVSISSLTNRQPLTPSRNHRPLSKNSLNLFVGENRNENNTSNCETVWPTDLRSKSQDSNWLSDKEKLCYFDNSLSDVDTIQVKNRKAEMEQRIRSGMSNIVDRGKDIDEDIVSDFKCWSDCSSKQEEWSFNKVHQGIVGDLLNSSVKKDSSLQQCLQDASRYATLLNVGLSRLPSKLNEICNI